MSAITREKARRTQMMTSETTNRIDDASSDFGLDDVEKVILTRRAERRPERYGSSGAIFAEAEDGNGPQRRVLGRDEIPAETRGRSVKFEWESDNQTDFGSVVRSSDSGRAEEQIEAVEDGEKARIRTGFRNRTETQTVQV